MNMIHLAGDCAVPVVGEVVKDGSHVGFIMNMEKPLDKCRPEGLSDKVIMQMMIDVVGKLHETGIIHSDIKLANMLYCSDGNIRLCDFAGATLITPRTKARSVYTVAWLSPYRSLHLEEPFTAEDDLFALGVSIWELCTGKRPFDGLQAAEIRELIRKGAVVTVADIHDDEVRHKVEELMSPMLGKTLVESQGLE